MVAGAFLRFWGTIHGSFAFTYDVGRDLLSVQKMIATQKISLLGPPMGIEGLFYGRWWYLFLAILFLASGGNPYWVVFSITVLRLIIIPLAYFLGKEIGGNLLGQGGKNRWFFYLGTAIFIVAQLLAFKEFLPRNKLVFLSATAEFSFE